MVSKNRLQESLPPTSGYGRPYSGSQTGALVGKESGIRTLTEPMPQPSKPFGGFIPAITRGSLEDLMLNPLEYRNLGAVQIFHRDDKLEITEEDDVTITQIRVVYKIYGGFGEEVIRSEQYLEKERIWDSPRALTEALISKQYVLTKYDEKKEHHHSTPLTYYIGDLYVKKT